MYKCLWSGVARRPVLRNAPPHGCRILIPCFCRKGQTVLFGAELFRVLRLVALISTFKALHPNYFHALVSNLHNCWCAVCWVARVKIPMKENRISCDYSDFSAKRLGGVSSKFISKQKGLLSQFVFLKWLALTQAFFWLSHWFESYVLF